MTLLLSNDDVSQLLNVEECASALEDAVREWADGDANSIPRNNFFAPAGHRNHFFSFGIMCGGSKKQEMYCIRMMDEIIYYEPERDRLKRYKYCIEPGTYVGLLFLFSTKNGEPLAIIPDGVIEHMRVAGETAVGVEMLARRDATTLGMLGSGSMAHSYAEAIKVRRDIKKMKVFSPNKEHRDRYAADMSKKLEIEVTAVDEPREAVRGVDIVCTCTDASEVVSTDWLEPGMLVCGVKGLTEMSGDLKDGFARLVTISTDDLISTEDRGGYVVGYTYFAGSEDEFAGVPGDRKGSSGSRYSQTRLLDIMKGTATGRANDAEIIHLAGGGYSSVGHVTLAGLAYTAAKQAGVGQELPLDWFTQKIQS